MPGNDGSIRIIYGGDEPFVPNSCHLIVRNALELELELWLVLHVTCWDGFSYYGEFLRGGFNMAFKHLLPVTNPVFPLPGRTLAEILYRSRQPTIHLRHFLLEHCHSASSIFSVDAM